MRPRVGFGFVSRRHLLVGGAAAAGAGVLPACDRLVLPDDSGADGESEPIDPITPNDDFYVTSCCGTPLVEAATWRLEVSDRGVPLGTIDLAGLQALPARDKEHTLQCIGSGPAHQAISNAVWSGLPLPEVLDAMGIVARADALQLVFTGVEGYSTAVPRGDLERPIWLVWRMNGEELPASHGFPARLLIPGRYGTKNVKWLAGIDLVDAPFEGFWEERGWSDDASYLANGFIRAPKAYTEVPLEGALVVGTAFAGSDPIARVEFSSDGGKTWADAEITYAGGPDVWTLWQFDWVPESVGDHTLKVRVTTESGATSAPQHEHTDSLVGYDGSMEATVVVV